MKVFYKFYQLEAQRSLNRLASGRSINGVHLKIEVRRDQSYADFFSHPNLGDIHTDEFLQTFKYQENDISKKTFHFLLNDYSSRNSTLNNLKVFKNHYLWNGKSITDHQIYKFKLQDESDFRFVELLKNDKTVRLDANGLFTQKTFSEFINNIDPRLIGRIQFIEDPSQEIVKNSPIPIAQDFIIQKDFSYLIHKPNRSFRTHTNAATIYSSYMGSQLGQWHSYIELINEGNLNDYHGVHIDNFYQYDIFDQLKNQEFFPNKSKIKKMYDEVHAGTWKLLCSI